MTRLIECVPNFSEGRDPLFLRGISEVLKSISRVKLLGSEADADHNRSVVTFAGQVNEVVEAAFKLTAYAVEKIDLNTHKGVHPRIGAIDVIPFVPLQEASQKECSDAARQLGGRIGDELNIPVFLYGESAENSDRRHLADIRRGGFEKLKTEPDLKSDFGPSQVHLTAGAVAVGARDILVAFNINLATTGIHIARQIAEELRESSGGLPCVKALGLTLESSDCVQISMNLTDYRVTSPTTVYNTVSEKARVLGISVKDVELIGLMPEAALGELLTLVTEPHNITSERIIENQLQKEGLL